MRIRSIKPEFWRSEDIAALNPLTRLLFIGLWSYVDDNGVGRDIVPLIVADLFPFDDPPETVATVSGGLQTLSERGQITRYEVAGRAYLYVNSWARHQRIDKPNKERYPLPTCEDAVIQEMVATPSRDSREIPSPGAVEQRNRGTEEKEKNSSSSAAPMTVVRDPDLFDEFWEHYPRKVGRQPALRAWINAMRRHENADVILAGVVRYANDPNLPEMNYIPHPVKWLNEKRWESGPEPARTSQGAGVGRAMSTGEQRALVALELAQRFKAEENNNQQLRQIGAA